MNTHRGVGRTKVYLRALAVSCGVMAASAAFPADAWSQARGLVYKQVLTSATPGASLFSKPTVVTFAPDGRLFVAQLDGRIFYATLDAGYNVVGTVGVINTIYNLGAADGRVGRQVTGMTFGPNGDLFVSHSNSGSDDPTINVNSGVISRLKASTNFAAPHDVVATNLPRSQHDHSSNGLAFKPGTNLLYLAQGGMTNAGSYDLTTLPTYDDNPETPLSASVLEIDIAATWPVTPTVYAKGFRNPYDLAWHSNGSLYLNDNGANANSGPQPDPGTCLPNYAVRPGSQDELNIVLPGQFYGHPNPSLLHCTFNGPGTVAPYVNYGWGTSSNGLAEYTSAKKPALKGRLLTANWAAHNIVSVHPTDGSLPQQIWPLAGTMTTFPIDVAVNPKGGGIFIAEFTFAPTPTPSAISVLRVKPAAPVDFNGDGRSDVGVMGHTTPFTWHWRNSATGTVTSIGPWGGNPHIPYAVDYHGDGSAEFATWNPLTGEWAVSGVGHLPMGAPGDLPLAGDVDGDGRTDLGYQSASTLIWSIRSSATGAVTTFGPFGGGTQVPFLLDLFGGGAALPVVWDPTVATYRVSGCCNIVMGSTGDTPVVGDVDNDGLIDLATHNPSTGIWTIRPTATGVITTLGPFGGGTQVPFLLDFNGDGHAKPAIWDPVGAQWHLYGVGVYGMGVPGDVPIRPSF